MYNYYCDPRGLMAATMDAGEAKRVAHQVFQDADKDKNGFLTKSEIRKYFKKHPAEKNRILGSDFKWNEFFTNMDKNGDNKFDVNEFTNFIVAEAEKANEAKRSADAAAKASRPGDATDAAASAGRTGSTSDTAVLSAATTEAGAIRRCHNRIFRLHVLRL